MPPARPRIGISGCLLHADPKRNIFGGKPLLFAVEAMLDWVMSEGALPLLLPRPAGLVDTGDLLDGIDGLVLQGGADVAPESYGDTPARPEWAGDGARDRYEMDLVRACLARNIPVLGICRGIQVLNVVLGGTLWQDIETMHPGRGCHRNREIYERHEHGLAIEPGSWLAGVYSAARDPVVNSVHHQGVKDLGRGLIVEARSAPDGVVEAVRYAPSGEERVPFVYGVQWHPEFIAAGSSRLLDPGLLLRSFLSEVNRRQ